MDIDELKEAIAGCDDIEVMIMPELKSGEVSLLLKSQLIDMLGVDLGPDILMVSAQDYKSLHDHRGMRDRLGRRHRVSEACTDRCHNG